MLPKETEIVYKCSIILLTVTDIIPVNFRKKWMAAESLITQPFLLPTKQALDQIKKFTTNFHILWELQKSLHQKEKDFCSVGKQSQNSKIKFHYSEICQAQRINIYSMQIKALCIFSKQAFICIYCSKDKNIGTTVPNETNSRPRSPAYAEQWPMAYTNGRVKQDTSPENSPKLPRICGLGFFEPGMMSFYLPDLNGFFFCEFFQSLLEPI